MQNQGELSSLGTRTGKLHQQLRDSSTTPNSSILSTSCYNAPWRTMGTGLKGVLTTCPPGVTILCSHALHSPGLSTKTSGNSIITQATCRHWTGLRGYLNSLNTSLPPSLLPLQANSRMPHFIYDARSLCGISKYRSHPPHIEVYSTHYNK